MIVRCQYYSDSQAQCRLDQGHAPQQHEDEQGNGRDGKWVLFRPEWGAYHMAAARLASTRGSCDRKQVGAVIVKGNRHLATGYNGSPAGAMTCEQAGHQLTTFADGSVSCVRTVHAEINAILQCAKFGVETRASTIYVTAGPCLACLNAIIQAGIVKVVFAAQPDKHWARGVDLAELALRAGVAWVST